MYALLLPSAHSFISSVEENVKVELRQISVPTGAPTPCLFGSPAWTDRVCGPHFCILEFFMVLELLAFKPFPASTILAPAHASAMSRRRRADRRGVCAWRSLFPPVH